MDKITHIPEELHQFTDETALIIVAAKQEGRVYKAGDGELELVEHFRVPTPHFSDNESVPGEEGKRENLGQELIHKDYFNHFKKLLHSLAPDFKPTHLYIFAPTHTANELEEIVKPIFGTLPTKTAAGIFTNESPFELFERLSH